MDTPNSPTLDYMGMNADEIFADRPRVKATSIAFPGWQGDKARFTGTPDQSVWEQAEAYLKDRALLAPDDGCYDKYNFEIIYDDGDSEGYKGRYDLKRQDIQFDDLLTRHIRSFNTFQAGLYRSFYSNEDYERIMAPKVVNNGVLGRREFLATYDLPGKWMPPVRSRPGAADLMVGDIVRIHNERDYDKSDMGVVMKIDGEWFTYVNIGQVEKTKLSEYVAGARLLALKLERVGNKVVGIDLDGSVEVIYTDIAESDFNLGLALEFARDSAITISGKLMGQLSNRLFTKTMSIYDRRGGYTRQTFDPPDWRWIADTREIALSARTAREIAV